MVDTRGGVRDKCSSPSRVQMEEYVLAARKSKYNMEALSRQLERVCRAPALGV
jgi:hypothetical protein